MVVLVLMACDEVTYIMRARETNCWVFWQSMSFVSLDFLMFLMLNLDGVCPYFPATLGNDRLIDFWEVHESGLHIGLIYSCRISPTHTHLFIIIGAIGMLDEIQTFLS